MAKKTFRCKLVTPAASLVNDEVTYASIPAWDGLMGVLPGRAPILARLGMGELKLAFPTTEKGAGGERSYFVDGGFIRMAADELMVLAENATPAEKLTVEAAEAELKAAGEMKGGADVKTRAADRARAKLAIVRRGGGI